MPGSDNPDAMKYTHPPSKVKKNAFLLLFPGHSLEFDSPTLEKSAAYYAQ